MQLSIRIVFMLLLSVEVYAGAPTDCRSAHWPYSSKVENLTPTSFKPVKRQYLEEYLFHELASSTDKRVPHLAEKILFYLKNTEQDEPKYYFYSAIELAADLNTRTPAVLSLSEICELKGKILRDPSSVKGKFKRPR